MLKTASLIGLILYFATLLLVVLKEKKNSDVEDYFFAGRSLPFWALSITFIASWWGGGSAAGCLSGPCASVRRCSSPGVASG